MNSNMLSLGPNDIYEFIVNALACKQVPYIAGPPAIGKSQVVHQVAADANAKVLDIRLSQMLSEDLTGLPEKDLDKGKAIYLPFETFPLEGDEIPEGYDGWIAFLDELSSASEEVLAAVYSVILDHMVGGRKIHPKCLVVAAGNRASDSAIARELPDTLITRMLPVEMKVSNSNWLDWAENHPNHNPAVVEFIRKNPNQLYAPTKAKERDELESYPTPRGWEKVFYHMNLHERQTRKEQERVDSAGVPIGGTDVSFGPISDGIMNLMTAAVGLMAATAFREEYDESIQLPYAWEIAQSPSSTRIPNNKIGKARVVEDCVSYFLTADDQSRDAVMTYINRFNDGEFFELFHRRLNESTGNTASDMKLLEKVAKRFNIDPILGTAVGGAADSQTF